MAKQTVEEKVQAALAKAEELLAKSHADSDSQGEDGVWGEGNTVEVHEFPSFFYLGLQKAGFVSDDYTLHVTADGSDDSYEEMSSRFVVFNGLSVIAAAWFDDIIDIKDGEYQGVQKDGLEALLRKIFEHEEKLQTA